VGRCSGGLLWTINEPWGSIKLLISWLPDRIPAFQECYCPINIISVLYYTTNHFLRLDWNTVGLCQVLKLARPHFHIIIIIMTVSLFASYCQFICSYHNIASLFVRIIIPTVSLLLSYWHFLCSLHIYRLFVRIIILSVSLFVSLPRQFLCCYHTYSFFVRFILTVYLFVSIILPVSLFVSLPRQFLCCYHTDSFFVRFILTAYLFVS
jgi:hypothetical protein